MSKKWTPELDAILPNGVFEECQISFGKALCKKIAERVRIPGKDTIAVTASGDTSASTPKKAAPKPKKEPATPKAKTLRVKKGAAKVKAEEEADGGPAPSAGRKKSIESEAAGEEKNVKLEQDVGKEDGAGEAEAEV
ncbi:hypothetical protein E8E11_011741 [Didymella keratinophila]|nr:hypothetical protein E8E11_011741 [Didymella keratinophila]